MTSVQLFRLMAGENEADRWVAQIKSWISCAWELRASKQRVDGVTITAFIGQ